MEEHDYDTLKNFLASVEAGEHGKLGMEEVKVLRRMISTFRLIESWGRLGKFALWILMGLGGAVAAWAQIKEGLGK